MIHDLFWKMNKSPVFLFFKNFSLLFIQEKIESLYGQKQARQDQLDEIKHAGRDLVEAPNTSDKNQLRETLADVQGKWHDLTELLVQRISFAVSSFRLFLQRCLRTACLFFILW